MCRCFDAPARDLQPRVIKYRWVGQTMKHIMTSKHRGKFDLLIRSRSAQAAMMTLLPGATSEDEPSNEHPRCEQWLLVLSGTGRATFHKPGKTFRHLNLRQN